MDFEKVTQEVLDEIQVNAGALYKNFDVETESADDSDLICATTGGITVSCVPTVEDWGEDIDNCPNHTKEMARITGWECTFGFTSVDVSETFIKLALGAADIDPETKKITPRTILKSEDFSDVWFISGKANGKVIAICLKNALSTGGFGLKTTKKNKGQVSVTLTGHVSISNPDEVPMEFWSKKV